jgi:hypothetical protein
VVHLTRKRITMKQNHTWFDPAILFFPIFVTSVSSYLTRKITWLRQVFHVPNVFSFFVILQMLVYLCPLIKHEKRGHRKCVPKTGTCICCLELSFSHKCLRPVCLGSSDWLKVLLADFLWEKNTAGWLTDLTDNLKRTGLVPRNLLSNTTIFQFLMIILVCYMPLILPGYQISHTIFWLLPCNARSLI